MLCQTKLNKIKNIIGGNSPKVIRERFNLLDVRFAQLQTIACKNKEFKNGSEMSSELNLSDSLEQKASYIYVEGL